MFHVLYASLPLLPPISSHLAWGAAQLNWNLFGNSNKKNQKERHRERVKRRGEDMMSRVKQEAALCSAVLTGCQHVVWLMCSQCSCSSRRFNEMINCCHGQQKPISSLINRPKLCGYGHKLGPSSASTMWVCLIRLQKLFSPATSTHCMHHFRLTVHQCVCVCLCACVNVQRVLHAHLTRPLTFCGGLSWVPCPLAAPHLIDWNCSPHLPQVAVAFASRAGAELRGPVRQADKLQRLGQNGQPERTADKVHSLAPIIDDLCTLVNMCEAMRCV